MSDITYSLFLLYGVGAESLEVLTRTCPPPSVSDAPGRLPGSFLVFTAVLYSPYALLKLLLTFTVPLNALLSPEGPAQIGSRLARGQPRSGLLNVGKRFSDCQLSIPHEPNLSGVL